MNLVAALEMCGRKAVKQNEMINDLKQVITTQGDQISQLINENHILKDEHAKLLCENQQLKRLLEIHNLIYPK